MKDTGTTDKLKGKAKEVAGKVTGNKRLESEGHADRVKGHAKEAVHDTREAARGVADSARNDRPVRPEDPVR